ncbi:hypothetical protein [Novosphingobium sp. JCM 18896]|uniref:PAS domain-containing protein n=1 Tax=Novosphingobium sp. JCM 18896 TaxID=2989731 RepID=UPI0022238B3D|nr:hypothetical protein [Novosphingobium sp. JCM 18896]MCW1431748.1 hypothetical protein [Novosphingobium sp. JCM 18896]
MDTLRGRLDGGQPYGEPYDSNDDDIGRDLPPAAVGQDERRMQVRAYNFWASMLDDRTFPSVSQLDLDNLPDFGPNSVLLDFTDGIENPGIRFLGAKLAEECDAEGPITHLADVPRRSLLSRITDHYMQILANQAPIGFEAEFVNQRGATILYRGILLPFADNEDAIDHIYGAINWKELADQKTTDELLLEIDQVLEAVPEIALSASPLTAWADGPADDSGVLDLVTPFEPEDSLVEWPEPGFGSLAYAVAEDAPLPADDADDMELADWLASARELAERARVSEDRSHQALYAAIGRAYDFALAAAAEPDQLQDMLEDAGLKAQQRAPLTPVVKLVFGADYDKTRLAEYASALGYAQRLDLPRGTLAAHLAEAPGGLKGVVAGERRLRREEAGKLVTPREAPRKALQRKLRNIAHQPLAEVSAQGSEFTLLVARRLDSGEVVLLGEVSDDLSLLERAANKLVA